MAEAKSINLLLYEGDLNGVISIEDTSWNSGELYMSPRASLAELLETGACNKYGVYLLLSEDRIYAGQSSDLAKRITQHTSGKDWWDRVVILTTKDDSLTHTDIDYLETVLIDKCQKLKNTECENKTKGNPPKVDKYRKVFLKSYLDEAMLLLHLVSINVFEDKKSKTKTAMIDLTDIQTKLAVGKGEKMAVVEYLEQQGIPLEKALTYAVKQEKTDFFWANPKVEYLNQDWSIILNNNVSHELILLRIPANSIKVITSEGDGVFARADRPHLLNLNINIDTLRERKSGYNFSKYVIKRISY